MSPGNSGILLKMPQSIGATLGGRAESKHSKNLITELNGPDLKGADVMKLPFLLGRLIFGGFFINSGIHHFTDRESLSKYAGSKKVPMPDLAVQASGAALILGGASILFGVKPKLGALALIGFLAGVTPVMHDFWNLEDPEKRQGEMVNFMKNAALLGGAMALMAIEEPWPASVPVAQPDAIEQARTFIKRPRAA